MDNARGGKRPGAGRKKGSIGKKDEGLKRHIHKGIRLTVEEYELITKAAQSMGITETTFIQWAASEKAKEITG